VQPHDFRRLLTRSFFQEPFNEAFVHGSNAGKFGRSGVSGETTNLSLNVNGSLAGMSRSEIKNIVKAAYMVVVTKGSSVRCVNASQARRGL